MSFPLIFFFHRLQNFRFAFLSNRCSALHALLYSLSTRFGCHSLVTSLVTLPPCIFCNALTVALAGVIKSAYGWSFNPDETVQRLPLRKFILKLFVSLVFQIFWIGLFVFCMRMLRITIVSPPTNAQVYKQLYCGTHNKKNTFACLLFITMNL